MAKATKATKATKGDKVAAPKATISAAPVQATPTLYIAGDKVTRPGTFFNKVQQFAKDPISLAQLITNLQSTHKDADPKLVPSSKKDHDMVIRVRTTYAANHGFLKAVKA